MRENNGKSGYSRAACNGGQTFVSFLTWLGKMVNRQLVWGVRTVSCVCGGMFGCVPPLANALLSFLMSAM